MNICCAEPKTTDSGPCMCLHRSNRDVLKSCSSPSSANDKMSQQVSNDLWVRLERLIAWRLLLRRRRRLPLRLPVSGTRSLASVESEIRPFVHPSVHLSKLPVIHRRSLLLWSMPRLIIRKSALSTTHYCRRWFPGNPTKTQRRKPNDESCNYHSRSSSILSDRQPKDVNRRGFGGEPVVGVPGTGLFGAGKLSHLICRLLHLDI